MTEPPAEAIRHVAPTAVAAALAALTVLRAAIYELRQKLSPSIHGGVAFRAAMQRASDEMNATSTWFTTRAVNDDAARAEALQRVRRVMADIGEAVADELGRMLR